ncbi:Crp/Fnr family transcriptional regulator [Pseudochelatococcus sp. B33]
MALSDDIALLSALPAFAGFEQAALRRLAISAQTRPVRAGEVLYRQGETAEGGFVIVNGEVALRDGAGHVRERAGPGCLLGELALVIEIEWQATAVVEEDGAVLRLSRALMGRVLEEFPLSASALQQAIAVQLRQLAMELDVVSRLLKSAQDAIPPDPADETAGSS